MKSMANQARINLQDITIVSGNQSMLDKIAPLWEELNRHHLKLSPNFKQCYCDMNFEKRKAALLKKASGGEMRVALVVDKKSGQNVGYCVTSLNMEKTGEIESILVTKAYRGLGIGDLLMKDALAWLDQKGATSKIVEVGAGNEQAFEFYGHYGFYPRKTVLLQKIE